jgi:hypothetical protein
MGTFPVEPHVIDLFWARNLGLRRRELAPNFPNIARGLFLTCQVSSVARPSHHALHDYIAIVMASKKDLRRPDLSKSPREEATIHLESCVVANILPVIPYEAPVVKEGATDFGSAMSSTIPMAAMFTRNKYIGW